jgi:beta-galactosidase GanA
VAQVYIFWNYHEPVEGEYDFSGRGNLTKFMSMASEAGLFVNLRIGPYVCAEWTYGGLRELHLALTPHLRTHV